MIGILRLLLPGLIPSWEFFKAVEPSPRVQWRMLAGPGGMKGAWQEFRPRPATISAGAMFARLFWNPRWNEALYLVSLSERLMLNPTGHSVTEIYHRLANEIERTLPPQDRLEHLQFRLIFVSRDAGQIVQTTTYVAEPCRLDCAAP